MELKKIWWRDPTPLCILKRYSPRVGCTICIFWNADLICCSQTLYLESKSKLLLPRKCTYIEQSNILLMWTEVKLGFKKTPKIILAIWYSLNFLLSPGCSLDYQDRKIVSLQFHNFNAMHTTRNQAPPHFGNMTDPTCSLPYQIIWELWCLSNIPKMQLSFRQRNDTDKSEWKTRVLTLVNTKTRFR